MIMSEVLKLKKYTHLVGHLRGRARGENLPIFVDPVS